MSNVLYRKYRPKNFSEIIGQEHVVRTLANAIQSGRTAQAYLFTGPRGTGKTSVARIFSRRINCQKPKTTDSCGKCQSCQIIDSGKSLDIVEIDAASNTGVDNIREFRETVALANSSLKYKIYIIDEAHMLSGGAWNALLKTLEEPPAHVIFILATTEIHKIPETILSRCQRFDFGRLPIQKIIEKLALIAKEEKIEIEKEALEMIAIGAEGGMRDAESLLGQVISLEDKKITAQETQAILGFGGKKASRLFVEDILEKKTAPAIEKINRLLEDGYDLEVFAKASLNYLRQIMLLKINPALKKYFAFEMTGEEAEKASALAEKSDLPVILEAIKYLLEAQAKISSESLPQLPLEIAAIKVTGKLPTGKEQGAQNLEHRKWEEKQEEKKKDSREKIMPMPSEALSTESVPLASANILSNQISLDDVKLNWKKLLTEIRPYNHSLSALLMSCVPTEIEKNILTLATPYDFYQERLNDVKNRLTVEEVFSKILGARLTVCVSLDKTLCEKKDPSEEISPICQQNPLLDDALEIMGGKIVE